MKSPLLHRLLELPPIYSLSQKLFAPGAGRLLKKNYKNIFSKSRGWILDVGCGPSLTTPLSHGIIVGIDINLRYVRKYTDVSITSNQHNKHLYKGKVKRQGIICSADSMPFCDNIFDESRSIGLLHHLPTESALSTIMEMIRCTRTDGMIIILDNIWPKIPLFRPLAWLTRRFDRGEWVRTEDELMKLTLAAHSGIWHHARFTYSYTGLEALLLTKQKPIDKRENI